jgi:ABC-type sugar transport system ATPase subunit
MSSILELRGVTKRFDAVTALDDVSLSVREGALHAVCGENGAGKSTLMKIIAGVLADYEGEMMLRGEIVRFAGPRDAEHAGVSIIHQELNLIEQLSATANVFLGRERRNRFGLLDMADMERAAGKLLAELECQIDPRAIVSTLRVGDQQLIEIAKALAIESDILIMDEPTSALTETEVARLYRVIERLQSRGVTILYISHKMDEIFRLATDITVLRDGRLVRTMSRSDATPQQVTHLMVGREIEATHFEPRPAADTLLEVEHLSLPWPGHARKWRLHDISFALRRGEILGIAGLMGAGRTELLESLFGASTMLPEGRITLEGRPAKFTHPAEARSAGIALVTEDRKRLGLFDHMSVGENITLCQLHDATTSGIVSPSNERRMADDIIDRLRVRTSGAGAAITSLSGGNQQKAIIGRWLLTNPRVLLLDDPTRGIDVAAKAELYGLFDRLSREGLGVIVTSSELPELLTLCDRILVLCEGRLTGEFTRAEATEHRIMEAATARQTVS